MQFVLLRAPARPQRAKLGPIQQLTNVNFLFGYLAIGTFRHGKWRSGLKLGSQSSVEVWGWG
jgi:hypothetical protein